MDRRTIGHALVPLSGICAATLLACLARFVCRKRFGIRAASSGRGKTPAGSATAPILGCWIATRTSPISRFPISRFPVTSLPCGLIGGARCWHPSTSIWMPSIVALRLNAGAACNVRRLTCSVRPTPDVRSISRPSPKRLANDTAGTASARACYLPGGWSRRVSR